MPASVARARLPPNAAAAMRRAGAKSRIFVEREMVSVIFTPCETVLRLAFRTASVYRLTLVSPGIANDDW